MKKSRTIKGRWFFVGALAAAAAPSHAQHHQAPFQVSGFAVEGRALLKGEDFTRVVSPYVGRGKTAADLERARLALQDTYHHLGYCTVRVTLAHAEPRDGMVTFRVDEVPASAVRDCLPAIVLDAPQHASPPAAPRPAGRAATVYSYADPREPGIPAQKPRAQPAPPLATAVPSQYTLQSPAETKPPVTAPVVAAIEPAKALPAAPVPVVSPPVAKPPAAAPAVTAGERAREGSVSPPGAAALPGEAESLTAPVLANERGKSFFARLKDSLLAESKNPPNGGSPFVGTAAAVAGPEHGPAATVLATRVARTEPAAVVARTDPVKTAPITTTPAPGAVVAQAEPAKPAPAKPVPAKPASAAAAEPLEPQAGPRFDITRYSVEGNTLLKQEKVERVLAPFAGPGKDFGDVQRALEALQLAYQKEGWGGVEIRLPEQELDKGEVKLRVVEPRIANVTVEKNEHFNEANIRRSVPALREGETPNSRDIGTNVRLANENPAKQTAVVLKASDKEDHLDAAIRVTDVDPRRFSISLDNTGTTETQRERLGLAFQHANLFNRDHILTLQFITAPKNFNDVLVYGVGYRIPLYALGDSVDLVAGYSNVDSGTVQDLFVVAGKGTVFAVRYNQNLPRWGDLEHKLSYGLDYRAYQNNVTPVGGTFKLVPDITVHPVSATYSGAWRAEGKGDFSYYLSLVQNIPGGNDGRDEDFKQVGARFPDGTAGYRMFRTGATYARPFGPDWQVRVRADGQYTDDALVSSEQFAIGGADSVRGFTERYTANDKGYRTSWEVYTPDMAKLARFEGRLRLLAFYDQGVVRRNKAQPAELVQASLDAGGVGLRLNYKTSLTLRFDVAYVFHDGSSTDGKDGQTKAHFALAWVW